MIFKKCEIFFLEKLTETICTQINRKTHRQIGRQADTKTDIQVYRERERREGRDTEKGREGGRLERCREKPQ